MIRYEMSTELGRGSMAVVHRAHDPEHDREVAIKTVLIPRGLNADEQDEFRERFLSEARAAGELSHPGIVAVYEAGEPDDGEGAFLAMEYVEGFTLDELIRREGSLRVDWALDVADTLADALQTAHDAGVIHGDLKPSNILVRETDGVAKIADFGLSRARGDSCGPSTIHGSVAYQAPECLLGQPAAARSDFFSLAAILYEALAGQTPFGGRDFAETCAAIINDRPRPIRRFEPLLSPAFESFFERALDRDPGERFGDGREFCRALRSVGEQQIAYRGQAVLYSADLPTDREAEVQPPVVTDQALTEFPVDTELAATSVESEWVADPVDSEMGTASVENEIVAASVDSEIGAASVENEIVADSVESEWVADPVDSEPVAASVDSEIGAASVESEPVAASVDSEMGAASVESEPVAASVDSEMGAASVESEPVAASVDSEIAAASVETETANPSVRPDVASVAAPADADPCDPPASSSASAADEPDGPRRRPVIVPGPKPEAAATAAEAGGSRVWIVAAVVALLLLIGVVAVVALRGGDSVPTTGSRIDTNAAGEAASPSSQVSEQQPAIGAANAQDRPDTQLTTESDVTPATPEPAKAKAEPPTKPTPVPVARKQPAASREAQPEPPTVAVGSTSGDPVADPAALETAGPDGGADSTLEGDAGAQPPAAVTDTATFEVEVKSSVKVGQLTLLVDGQEVYSAELGSDSGKLARTYTKLVGKGRQSLDARIDISPGLHTVTAQVYSEKKARHYADSVDVEVQAGDTRVLRVVAGKTFGRWLTVSFED